MSDDNDNLLTRREFTLEWAVAILSAATITISCGDDEPTTTPTSSDHSGTVSANHGHVATVTAARITAAQGFALDIRGDATHPHLVELTAAEVASIGANGRVQKTSSTDNAHSHTVTFN